MEVRRRHRPPNPAGKRAKVSDRGDAAIGVRFTHVGCSPLELHARDVAWLELIGIGAADEADLYGVTASMIRKVIFSACAHSDAVHPWLNQFRSEASNGLGKKRKCDA